MLANGIFDCANGGIEFDGGGEVACQTLGPAIRFDCYWSDRCSASGNERICIGRYRKRSARGPCRRACAQLYKPLHDLASFLSSSRAYIRESRRATFKTRTVDCVCRRLDRSSGLIASNSTGTRKLYAVSSATPTAISRCTT